MLGATIISNPLTIPFLYLAGYELGVLVLGLGANPFVLADYDVRSILEIGWHILYPLMVGGLILACCVRRAVVFHHPSCRRKAEKPQCRAL